MSKYRIYNHVWVLNEHGEIASLTSPEQRRYVVCDCDTIEQATAYAERFDRALESMPDREFRKFEGSDGIQLEEIDTGKIANWVGIEQTDDGWLECD